MRKIQNEIGKLLSGCGSKVIIRFHSVILRGSDARRLRSAWRPDGAADHRGVDPRRLLARQTIRIAPALSAPRWPAGNRQLPSTGPDLPTEDASLNARIAGALDGGRSTSPPSGIRAQMGPIERPAKSRALCGVSREFTRREYSLRLSGDHTR